MNSYDDIIDLPHHVSAKHPHMPIEKRAAQFLPFAAVVGYDDSVEEAGRFTDSFIPLSDDEASELDRKISYLTGHISDCPSVRITYFVPDERKDGGRYVTRKGTLRRIDEAAGMLEFSDRTAVEILLVRGIEIFVKN